MTETNDRESAAPDAGMRTVERVLVTMRSVFMVVATVAFLLAIVNYAQQHSLFRSRTPAGLTRAQSNIKEVIKVSLIYADQTSDGKTFPTDLRVLYPDYISDWKVFLNPRFKAENLGFIYVPGTNLDSENEVMLYEDVPPGFEGKRVVGFTSMSARQITADEFQEALQNTIAALQARGVPFNPQRLPVKEAEWRAYAAEQAAMKAISTQTGTNTP
jgi:hypothetical protein